jgi:hypothetical protein
MTNTINNRNAYLGYVKNPILEDLLTKVEFTDNPYDCVEFKVLQEICRTPFNKGSTAYRELSKNKLLDKMHRDEKWIRKLNDCRIQFNGLTNVICYLRLK